MCSVKWSGNEGKQSRAQGVCFKCTKTKSWSDLRNILMTEMLQTLIVFFVIRCSPGTKPDPECDPSLEAEVVKPEKCGKITDKTGPFRWEHALCDLDETLSSQTQTHDDEWKTLKGKNGHRAEMKNGNFLHQHSSSGNVWIGVLFYVSNLHHISLRLLRLLPTLSALFYLCVGVRIRYSECVKGWRVWPVSDMNVAKDPWRWRFIGLIMSDFMRR